MQCKNASRSVAGMVQRFTENLVIRVDPEMRAALEADSAENERRVSQTVRRAIRLYLSPDGQDLARELSR